MSFRRRSHVCAREECAGIAAYTRGDGGERRWAHLSHLLPIQLVLGRGGSRSGSPWSRSSQEPVLPSCLLGVSVTALKQAYILLGVSLEASSIFCTGGYAQIDLDLQRGLYMLATLRKISLFFMESQLYSHLSACIWLLIGTLPVQESTKQKAGDGQ